MHRKSLHTAFILAGILSFFGCAERRGEQSIGGDRQMEVSEIFASSQTRALASAACNHDVGGVRALLANGAMADDVGKFGVTPLIWTLTCKGIKFNSTLANVAYRNGRRTEIPHSDPRLISVINQLLEAGADPNRKISGNYGPVFPGSADYWIDGYSALLIAAEFHPVGVVELLLADGVDPNSASSDGSKTALTVAFDRGYWLDSGPKAIPSDGEAWANLFALLDAGARTDDGGHNNQNILELATIRNIDISRKIIENYEYNGRWNSIVLIVYNSIKVGFPESEKRQDFLDFLRVHKGVDVDGIIESINS